VWMMSVATVVPPALLFIRFSLTRRRRDSVPR
jgi:hypothetical protein